MVSKFTIIFFAFIAILLWQCKSSDTSKMTNDSVNYMAASEVLSDTITISNPDAEYDIIIIEPGFAQWLATQLPKESYTADVLAIRNRTKVAEWNRRVGQPTRFNAQLYEQPINYFSNVDYGLEVNYKLFMYFKFFEKKYSQNLLQ